MFRWVAGKRLRAVIVGSVVALAALGLSAGIALAASLGGPDTSFGSGGVTYAQFARKLPANGGGSLGGDVVVAPDGDYYVAGMADDNNGNEAVYVARYLPSGMIDTGFGDGGSSVWNVGAGTTPATGGSPAYAGVVRMALTPSGDPVVATSATDANGNSEVAVLEFNTDGTLNTSGFDPAGPQPGAVLQQLGSGSEALGLAVQPDGKIVITGDEEVTSGNPATTTREFFAERLNTDGSVDTAFGGDGVYAADYALAAGGTSVGYDVHVDPDGDLTFAGQATDALAGGTLDSDFLLVRLTPSGTPDPTFNSGNPVELQPDPSAPAGSRTAAALRLAETPGGDYVLAGTATDANGDEELAAAELTTAGAPDTQFGTGGVYVQQLAQPGGETSMPGLALQPDGKIDLIGLVGNSTAQSVQQAVVRLLPDGTPDPSFGSAGVATEQLANGGATGEGSEAFGGAIAPDGDLILTGLATTSSADVFETYLTALTTDVAPSVTFSYAPAAAGGSSSPQAGESLTFTSAPTLNGGDPIASTAWDFGSGSFSDASGATVQHTFASPGTYVVRVQVTDEDGLTATSSQTVTVAPATISVPGTQTSTTPTHTPTTASKPTPTPAPKLRVSAVKLSGSAVKLKLSCSVAPCKGSVGLSALEHLLGRKLVAVTARAKKPVAKKHTTRVKLGTASYSLAAGKSRTLTVKLNADGRRLLARYRKLAATLTVTLRVGKPKQATVATRRLTFKQPKPKVKRPRLR